MTETTSKILDIDTVVVDTETVAGFFLVTRRSVERYAKDSGMPKKGRNQFVLKECVNWYVQHLVERGAGGDDDSITEERRLLVKTQRQRIELEIQKRRGELLEADEVQQVLNEMATIYARHLESLASRVSKTIAGISDPKQVQKTLTDETRAIRTATSAAVIDFATSHDGVGNTRTAAGKKRRRVGGRRKNIANRSA